MLAYLFGDAWRDPELQAVLEHATRIRDERAAEMVNRLNALGIMLTMAENLRTGSVWEAVMSTSEAQRGMAAVGLARA